MSLDLTPEEQIARLRADLRMGVPILINTSDGTVLIAAAETLDRSRWDDLCGLNRAIMLAITARRAETLRVTAYDGDLARIQVPRGADLGWVQAMADPSRDLDTPMKGPCQTKRGGTAEVQRAALSLIKLSRLLPAAISVDLEPTDIAALADLHPISLKVLVTALKRSSPLAEIASARVPLEVSEAGRLHVFRPADGGEEHYAVEIGKPSRTEPVLSRLHSACFTGDLLGSLKCDCGPQLRAALRQIGAEGAGVLLYMNQEGRGIGLANKMRAYSLQDQGFDTVEANHRLGFEDDERDFRLAAEILRAMGFSATRLMTNNPGKVAMMEASGISVKERVALKVGENPHNRAYLATKAKKSGHLL